MALTAMALLVAAPGRAQDAQTARHDVTGMVIEVHPTREQFVVSHEAIPDVMSAMTMPFEVRQPQDLDGIEPGMRVSFTLVIGPESAHAERIRIVRYRTAEQDPFTANRLRVLTEVTSGAIEGLSVGETVPDFSLIDQARRRVTLSHLRGRVVGINFIYASCAQPQFCFRIANHFGAIQRRFPDELADDLVLLTITFDPTRDTPEALASYARRQLRADGDSWRFLTGDPADVRKVCDMFGVDAFLDEGLMNHSSRTVVIDRRGTMVANIEGNVFTTQQLGDLVASVLRR